MLLGSWTDELRLVGFEEDVDLAAWVEDCLHGHAERGYQRNERRKMLGF